MDLSNKILSKVSLSWMDVQKQLLNVMQTRTTTGISVSSLQNATSGGTGTATSSSTIAINKIFVKQCTDFLIKHIKNLNQKQIIDHLENLAQSSGLMVFKTPSEEDPATINAFLNTDDFYFEVSINSKGEITDVKFSICSEPAK
jgi:surface antigen